jgi:uncharacterized protein (TIGR03000 family)
MRKFVCFAAFGLIALFTASPAPAAAQYIVRNYAWTPRVIGAGWGRYRLYDWSESPRFYRRYWRTTYYYPYSGPSNSYTYRAFYPQDEAVDVNTVGLRLHVPSDARIWIEGEATSTGGTDRSFVSPPLTPGRDYVYHVRVQWNENGKAVERNREITVHAGDRLSVNIDK